MGKRNLLTEAIGSDELTEPAQELRDVMIESMMQVFEDKAEDMIFEAYGRHADLVEERTSELVDRLFLRMSQIIAEV